jgi:3'-phosphoadenosine 5'-phosphosulfate sulfotransferase (PAPS reductase)/FAD synthetase
MARQDTGLKLVLTGKREADFNKRKMSLRVGKSTKEMHPLAKWSKYDVLAYLKRNNIPIPDQGRKDAGGIDLTAPSLLHLHDHHPNDFQRILRYFPFAQAVVKRREFHGIGT